MQGEYGIMNAHFFEERCCKVVSKTSIKRKKWLLIAAAAILLLIAVAAVCVYLFPIGVLPVGNYSRMEALPADHPLTAEEVRADRDQCIRIVEETHPYFITVEDQSPYEAAKERYMAATDGPMTAGGFQSVTAEYLCFFGDGHTGVRWAEAEYLNLPQTYADGRTWQLDENGEQICSVETIGGVAIGEIYATIDRTFPAENEMAQERNRQNRITGRNLLTLAGAAINDNAVTVTFSNGVEAEYTFQKPGSGSGSGEDNDPVNRWYMDGDVFVVDFNMCDDNDELKAIAAELKKAVDGGCMKVIIDVRDNPGGNSNACTRLLNAMGMGAPQYDMLVRFSPLAQQGRGYLRQSGEFRYTGSDAAVKRNENVRLAVLCDRVTFSSATMMCVYVRDGGHGVLIGEPSSNRPSAYGDILYFSLENSHVNACISHKQFIRPDEANTERMLVPDFWVDPTGAYDAAMDWLAQSN